MPPHSDTKFYVTLCRSIVPPNNQGIVALIMLKILEKTGFGTNDATSAERYHMMMEAGRLAYRAGRIPRRISPRRVSGPRRPMTATLAPRCSRRTS